jgi:hypothetical protein
MIDTSNTQANIHDDVEIIDTRSFETKAIEI